MRFADKKATSMAIYYSKELFKPSVLDPTGTLERVAALLRTKRPSMRTSFCSRYAANSSNIKKPQTTNGKYLQTTRVTENDDPTHKSKQFTATRCWFLLQPQASAENCSWLLQQHPRIQTRG